MSLIKKDKVIMTVGVCNCSGCSGLVTDVSLARMLQCFPMTVASCVASEGPGGFRKVQAVGIDMFRDELESILANVRPDAVKVGFLPSAKHMELLTSMLDMYEHGPVVFAPGLFYSSGSETLRTDWTDHPDTLVNFMAHVELFIPNLPELSMLVDPLVSNGIVNRENTADGDSDRLYEIVFRMHVAHMYYGAKNVLLVGGVNEEIPFTEVLLLDDEVHTANPSASPLADPLANPLANPLDDSVDDSVDDPGNDLGDDPGDDLGDDHTSDTGDHAGAFSDTAYDADERMEVNSRLNIHVMQGARIDTPNTRGLCDIYSTALASLFAMDLKLPEAAVLAKRFTSMLLESGKDWRLYEQGDGPAFAMLKLPDGSGDGPSSGPGDARPGILDMEFPGIFN